MMDLAFHRLDWINISCPSNPVWFSLPGTAKSWWEEEEDACVCVCVRAIIF